MAQLHVLFHSGVRADFAAIADVQPDPGVFPPPEPMPELIVWSTTGIGGVQAPVHGYARAAEVAAYWTTQD